MVKKSLPPDTILFPLPTVLLTTAGPERANIITLAWVGVVCSDPPMVSVSIRPSRFSHHLLAETGEFVLNIPPASLLSETDFCGTISGRQVDKFAAAGLTPVASTRVKPPLIAECPVNLECAVRQTIRLGSHDMFIGEILAVHVDASNIKDGRRLDLEGFDPCAYFPGVNQYRAVGRVLGSYGFTKGKLGKY